jgi:hypothetical protein
MTDQPEIITSIYDRPWTIRRVVRHPDPLYSADYFAVWNSQTGEYKLDQDSGQVRRYHLSSLSLAGYQASDDDSWYREIGREVPHRRYGPFTP